jgi:ribosome biogenesis protein Nip4
VVIGYRISGCFYNNIAFNAQKLNYLDTILKVLKSVKSDEKRISIINIDFLMRSKMITYLKKQNVENYCAIFLHNNNIIKELKYEKVFLILRNKKIKVCFLHR